MNGKARRTVKGKGDGARLAKLGAARFQAPKPEKPLTTLFGRFPVYRDPTNPTGIRITEKSK